MERWEGRFALVTGASSGIGAAISQELVRRGMQVVGCARQVEKIEEISKKLSGEKGKLHPEKCDLSKEEDILAMFERIKTKYGGVDVCINNAGLSLSAPLLTGETNYWRSMLDINILAVCICTREAYKSMKERNVNDGHIININSMTSHIDVNNDQLHFYKATKLAMKGLLHGLRNEIKATRTHIRVTELSPAVTDTDFFRRLGGEDLHNALIDSDESKRYMTSLRANDVANAVVYALASPPEVEIFDVHFWATNYPKW